MSRRSVDPAAHALGALGLLVPVHQGRARGRRVAGGDRLRAHRARGARAAPARRAPRRARRPARQRRPDRSLSRVVQMGGPLLLIAAGEQHISSSLTGILVATAPIFTFLLAFALERRGARLRPQPGAASRSASGAWRCCSGSTPAAEPRAGGRPHGRGRQLRLRHRWLVGQAARARRPARRDGRRARRPSRRCSLRPPRSAPAVARARASTRCARSLDARRALHRRRLRHLLLARVERRAGHAPRSSATSRPASAISTG